MKDKIKQNPQEIKENEKNFDSFYDVYRYMTSLDDDFYDYDEDANRIFTEQLLKTIFE